MKLMFVGSVRHDESNDFPFRRAGREFGYNAARRGHTILVCSVKKRTLDPWIMKGARDYAREHPGRHVFVDVYYPEKRAAPYQDDFNLDNLIIARHPQRDLKGKAGRKGYSNLVPHVAMLDVCDAVIAVGGGANTFIDGHIAANRGTPVFAVRRSGGSARRLYKYLHSKYSPPVRDALSLWDKGSAERILGFAEDTQRSVDVAIVCPLRKEREAVCEALDFTEAHRISRGARNYWRGHVGRSDGAAPPYDAVVAQLTDQGNLAAAGTTARVLADWRPRAILVVGIAAGVGEVALGDVVVGSAVFYYERGKVTERGTSPEPYMYPADTLLYDKAMTMGRWTEPIHAVRPDGSQTRPKMAYGVIASGEKVIADAVMREQISHGHRKIAAIEMEGYGVAAAVWQHGRRVRQLAIRGICDTADRNKGDTWQEYAAAAAASFTRDYLLGRPLPPRPSRWRFAAGS